MAVGRFGMVLCHDRIKVKRETVSISHVRRHVVANCVLGVLLASESLSFLDTVRGLNPFRKLYSMKKVMVVLARPVQCAVQIGDTEVQCNLLSSYLVKGEPIIAILKNEKLLVKGGRGNRGSRFVDGDGNDLEDRGGDVGKEKAAV